MSIPAATLPLLLAAMLPFWRKYALGIQGKVDVFGISMSGGDAEAVLLGVPTGFAVAAAPTAPYPPPTGLSNMVTSVISTKDCTVDILLFHIF